MFDNCLVGCALLFFFQHYGDCGHYALLASTLSFLAQGLLNILVGEMDPPIHATLICFVILICSYKGELLLFQTSIWKSGPQG